MAGLAVRSAGAQPLFEAEGSAEKFDRRIDVVVDEVRHNCSRRCGAVDNHDGILRPRRSRLCVTSFTKLLIQLENALKRFEVAVTV
jgi:hypothetical protein